MAQMLEDVHGRFVRLTDERMHHLHDSHPEMPGQFDRIAETLRRPERIVRSRSDPAVELFYREYRKTPVTKKTLCAVMKGGLEAPFLITDYFTDSAKDGEMLWEKP